MDKFIFHLKSFSLRGAVAILIGATVFLQYLGSVSEALYVSGALLLSVAYILFYSSWAAQAIKDDKKAILVSWVVIVTVGINLIGQLVDMDALRVGLYYKDFISALIFSSMSKTALTTQIIQSLVIGSIFLYTISEVDSKYKFLWIIQILTFGFSALYLIIVIGNTMGEIFLPVFWTEMLLEIIVIIGLLIVGNNKKSQASTDSINEDINNESKHMNQQSLSNSNNAQESLLAASKDLFKLKELLDAGILTQEEFDNEKKRILNK